MSESTEPNGTDTVPTGEGTPTTTPPTTDAARIAALEADVTKWKGLSRMHEKAAGKTTVEPVKEAAKAPSEEIAALRADMAREKAQLKLETAAAKAGVELDGLMEFVTLDKFISDGAVQTDVIDTFVGNFAAKAAKEPKFAQGIGVGPQAGGVPGQLTKADLKSMTNDQITKATDEGRFDRLLGRIK